MSNSINQEEDKLLNSENNADISKNKLIILYSLTIGFVLLTIIIVFLISSNLGNSNKNPSENNNINLFLKFKPDVGAETLLFNQKLVYLISSMKIDEQKISNVTNVYIFNSTDEHIVEIQLKENLDDMSQLFKECVKLSEVDLSNVDTKNVKNMSEMFYNCNSLTSINLSNINTKKVVDMSYLFHGCIFLNSLNLNKFDTSKVENIEYMFSKCTINIIRYQKF